MDAIRQEVGVHPGEHLMDRYRLAHPPAVVFEPLLRPVAEMGRVFGEHGLTYGVVMGATTAVVVVPGSEVWCVSLLDGTTSAAAGTIALSVGNAASDFMYMAQLASSQSLQWAGSLWLVGKQQLRVVCENSGNVGLNVWYERYVRP